MVVVLPPASSGAGDNDCSSTFDSVELGKDVSFRSVLRLIRDFYNMEEPSSVDPNRCKSSFAPVYRLQSESSLALHLPLSPLLRSLLKHTNLAPPEFVGYQTVNGLLPFPGHRHQKYYRTSSSSSPGPSTVPPGLASITVGKVSESRKCSVSLSRTLVSSLESSRVCVRSPPGRTCRSFLVHLPDEARGVFERLMLSGSKALGVPGWPGRHGSR